MPTTDDIDATLALPRQLLLPELLRLLLFPGRGTEASIPASPSTRESTIPPFGFWI